MLRTIQQHLLHGNAMKLLVGLAVVISVGFVAAQEINVADSHERQIQDRRVLQKWQTASDHFRANQTVLALKEFDKLSESMGSRAAQDTGLRLWRILCQQSNGNVEDALTEWNDVNLPPATAVWKEISVAALYLQSGQLDLALRALERGESLTEAHPLLHYYRALWNIAMAENGSEYQDATGRTTIRLMAYRPGGSVPQKEIAPHHRTLYQRTAVEELEQAIGMSDGIETFQPLLPANWTNAPTVRPTVGDLMASLRCELFLAKSHAAIGDLLIELGSVNHAEEHLDAAALLGERLLKSYAKLGRLYAQEHRHRDAARAYAQALKNEAPRLGTLGKLLGNLKDAIRMEDFLQH